MKTKLIEGVPPLPNDAEIVAAIQSEDDPDSIGRYMDFAILGPDRRIYRTVRTLGSLEYLEFASKLKALGLENLGMVADESETVYEMFGTPRTAAECPGLH